MNKSSIWPAIGGCVFLAACAVVTSAAPMTLTLDEQQIVVKVDTENCRWSAELKGTQLRLNNVHFLEGDNPLGWAVTAKVNRHDEGPLGSFETVTLHGTQKGRLDFDYHISASKTGNDIIVRLDRANHTGAPVEIDDMDYMVADDVRLGGIIDKWLTFGTKSVFNQYYGLTLVRDLPRITRGVGAQHHTNLLPGTP